jgi:hypothetical protein
MGLLYYKSGAKAANSEKVKEWGLAYAFEDLGGYRECKGPDGEDGVMFAENGEELGYHKDRQSWAPYPGQEGLWVGWYIDAKPGPKELSRQKQVPGYTVELTDGNEWEIPVALMPGDPPQPALPRVLKWDGDSWTPGRVAEVYRCFWDTACAVFEQVLEAHKGDAYGVVADTSDLAAQAMTINYRIGPAEISVLELWESGHDEAIALLATNYPLWAEAGILAEQKKTEAEPELE